MRSHTATRAWRTFARACAAITACLLVAPWWAPALAATPPPQLDTALLARLSLMRDVAHAKFAHGTPVEDLPREAEVLARMQARGEALGLTATGSRTLGAALIEASKSIQRHWFDRWRSSRAPDGPAPDLARDLRPRIDAATDALLVAAVLAPPAGAATGQRQAADARRERALAALGVDDAQIAALQAALAGLALAPVTLADSTLDRIARRGWLRVGVPGDYAPFAFPAATAGQTPPAPGPVESSSLRGIDIELANALARSLGVELQIVPTAWANLTADLAAQRFDIAMGGVSRSLARQRVGMFSTPYFEDGKGAIVRCSDVARFRTLADIDAPGVRVLVNRGGGNEQFVRTALTRADVRVRDDNLSIFPALVRGEGDVMFTDSAEIRWQARLEPRLCQALDGARLNQLDKAVLLPRDPVLRDYLDLFLAQLKDSGELSRIVSRYLP